MVDKYELRLGHRFGYGTNYYYNPSILIPSVVRRNLKSADIGFDFSLIRQAALALGWSNGCPVALELTDPANPNYGPEKMLKRYSETSFTFSTSRSHLRSIGKSYPWEAPRQHGEIPKRYEAESVPLRAFREKLAPMTRAHGYALGRIPLEGNAQPYTGWNNALANMDRILDLVSSAVPETNSIDDFIANLAGISIKRGADFAQVLSHLLPKGLLEEEGCMTDLKNIARSFEKFHPELFRVYQGMSSNELKALGIVELF